MALMDENAIPDGFTSWQGDDADVIPAGFSLYQPEPTQPPQSTGFAERLGRDTATALGHGIVDVGESVVGLADLATAGWAGKGLASIGYDPKATHAFIDQGYSPETQAAITNVDQAQGWQDKFSTAIENPSSIYTGVVRALPQMIGTKGIGDLAKTKGAANWLAHGAEGALTAGNIAEQIRQEQPDNTAGLYAAIPAGVGTALIGRGVSAIPGLGDADTAILRSGLAREVSGSLPVRAVKTALGEGIEEAAQSAQEQAFTNIGMGKPAEEGVPEQTVMGFLTGAALGGPIGALSGKPQAAQEPIIPTPAPVTNGGIPGDTYKPETIEEGERFIHELSGELDAEATGIQNDQDTANRLAQEAAQTAAANQAANAGEQLVGAEPTGNPVNTGTVGLDQSGVQPGIDLSTTTTSTLGDINGQENAYEEGQRRQETLLTPTETPTEAPAQPVNQWVATNYDGIIKQRKQVMDAEGLQGNGADHFTLSKQKASDGTTQWLLQRKKPIETVTDATLQPRDRSTADSVLQMQNIKTNPDYGRLGTGNTVDLAAPLVSSKTPALQPQQLGREDTVVFADGTRMPFRYAVVEADQVAASNDAAGNTNPNYAATTGLRALNNGRTAGLQAAYQNGTAEGYRAELTNDAARHGIDPAIIQSMRQPVLTRVYDDSYNTSIPDIGAKSNQRTNAQMGIREQAKLDASRLSDDIANLTVNPDITHGDNADFIRAALDQIASSNERGNLIDSTGGLSQDGKKRLQSALTMKAYDAPDIVDDRFVSNDHDIKSIGTALTDAAPSMLQVKAAAKTNAIAPEWDITPAIADAARIVRQARQQNKAVADLANNIDIERGETPQMTRDVLGLLFKDSQFTQQRSQKAIAEGLRQYAQQAIASANADMFGQMATPSDALKQVASPTTAAPENIVGVQPLSATPRTDVAARKSIISKLMPFNIQGNKSELMAKGLDSIIETAVKLSNRVIDAFGGSGTYTHYLASTGATKGKQVILNEWEPLRTITHQQIRDNPDKVIERVNHHHDQIKTMMGDIQNGSRFDTAAKTRSKITQYLRDQINAHAIPGQTITKGQPIELNNDPDLAALYYIAQGVRFGFRPIQSDANASGVIDVMADAENELVANTKGKVKLYARSRSRDRLNNPASYITPASVRLKDADIRRGDGWALAKTAGEGDTVLVDTSYLNKKDDSGKTIKTANYNKATEEDADPLIYLRKVDDNLLDAWDRGARLIITNNYDTGVAEHLSKLGFTLLSDNRAQGVSSDTRELIAINFDPATGAINPGRASVGNSASRRATETDNAGRSENNVPPAAGTVATGTNQESGTVHRSGGQRGLKFSHAAPKPQPKSTTTKLPSAIRAALGKKADAILKQVHVVQSVDDIPADVLKRGDILYHRVWHGSPHDFDQFTSDRIGTGEGAQAYGYGLYFAGAKNVAEWYRDKLTKSRISNDATTRMKSILVNGQPIIGKYDIETDSQLIELSKNNDLFGAYFYADERRSRWESWAKEEDYPHKDYARKKAEGWAKLAQDLETKGASISNSENGRLYEVELAPTEDEYLLWDKPLSEQSEKVKKAIAKLLKQHKNVLPSIDNYLIFKDGGDYKIKYQDGEIDFLSWPAIDENLDSVTRRAESEYANHLSETTGAQLYKILSSSVFKYDDKSASEYLRSLGVRGIKYLDGSSRGTGEGNYNYVVFDDSDISIVNKYSKSAANIQGLFDPKTGQAYLIADNVSEADAPGIAAHEAIHAAIEQGRQGNSRIKYLLGDQYGALIKRLKAMRNMGTAEDRRVLNEAWQAVQAAKTPEADIDEEFLTYTAEKFINDPNAPTGLKRWIADVLSAIRQAIYKIGKNLGIDTNQLGKLLTVQDIVSLAMADVQNAAKPKQTVKDRNNANPVPDFDMAAFAVAGFARASTSTGEPSAAEIAEAKRQLDDVRKRYQGTDQWMKAPNGKPTKLNEMQWLQTRTENFKRWFGDSKVVDENGDPLVVYHGSPSGSIDVFDKSKEGTNTGAATKDHGLGGFYFTPDAGIADTYARTSDVEFADIAEREIGVKPPSDLPQSTLYPVFLAIQRPVSLSDGAITKKILDGAKSSNADGIIKAGDYPEIVAFRPEQIKSATGNVGTFSDRTGNIRFSTASPHRAYTPEQEAIIGQHTADTTATPESWWSKVRSTVTGDNFRQKIFDRYHSFKEILDDREAWMMARLAGTSANVVHGAMEYGTPKLDASGAVDIDTQGASLRKVLDALGGDPRELDDFMRWVAAGRAQRINQKAAQAAAEAIQLKDEAKQLRKDAQDLMYGSITPKTRQLINQYLALAKMKTDDAKGKLEQAKIRERYLSAKNFGGVDPIPHLLALNRGTLANGQSRQQAYNNAWAELKTLNEAFVDLGVKSGTVSAADAQRWKTEGFYVPFYRYLGEQKVQGGSAGLDSLANNTAFHQYTGRDIAHADLLTNVIGNWHHLADTALKNQAAAKALQTAEQMGFAKPAHNEIQAGKGGIFIRKNGKPQWYKFEETPDAQLVLDSLSAMNYSVNRNPVLTAAGTLSGILRAGVTLNPVFTVRNLIRDTIHSLAAVNVSVNPFKNVATGWKATKPDTDAFARMLVSGGLFGHDSGYLHERNQVAKKDAILRAIEDPTYLNTWGKVKAAFDKYREIGGRAENINRAAAFQNVLKQGGSLLEAAHEANDVLAFQVHGSSAMMYETARVVAFLNARLQGLDKLYRAATDPQQRKQFITVGSMYIALSVLGYLLVSDDDEYKKLEEWEKDAFNYFKIGDKLYRIPRPFELGVAGAMAERMAQQFVENGQVPRKLLVDRLITNIGETLAMNPVPTALQPTVNVLRNKEAFSGRPIEGLGMQYMDKADRANSHTSRLAIGLAKGMDAIAGVAGKDTPLSPVQIDSLIRGHMGWLGMWAISSVDSIIDWSVGKQRPADMRNIPFIGKIGSDLIRVIKPEDNKASTKYTTEFYDNLQELRELTKSIRDARDSGDFDRMREIVGENKDAIRWEKSYNATARWLSDMGKRIRQIENDKTMSAQDKRNRIDAINEMRTQRLRKVMDNSRMSF